MTNVLFICKYNRYRSKIAEAIFNKLNKDKSNQAKSAGMIRGSPISKEIFEAAEKSGYPIKGEPQGLSTEILQWHDLPIIVADDVPKVIFEDNRRYGHQEPIIWAIKDNCGSDVEVMRRTITQIEKKVKELLKGLK